MQHATERVERPGESQEALDGKKEMCFDIFLVDNYQTRNKTRIPTPDRDKEHNRENRGGRGEFTSAQHALHCATDQSWVSHVGLFFGENTSTKIWGE